MPGINIFKDDAFSVQTLTAAINNPPVGQVVPTVLDALFSGNEEGVTTTMISIERDNDSLALVSNSERGSVGDTDAVARRDAIPFKLLHLQENGKVIADEVQNLRAFGKETEVETVQGMFMKKLFKAQAKINATKVFHRFGAITGKILDANGTTVLEDLFGRFGFEQETITIPFWDQTKDVANYIRSAKRYSEDVIGSSGVINGYLALTGRDFYDAFVPHTSVKDAFNFYQGGVFKIQDNRIPGFPFQGVTWQEFYGKVGDRLFMQPNETYLIPLGVIDLFMTRYGPADFVETANTMGQPFYAKQEPMKMDKGIEFEVQSNPIHLCTKPHAIIKLVAQTTKP